MIIKIIQMIDQLFTTLVFLPIIIILIRKFNVFKNWGRRMKIIYRICTILVLLFLVRLFCQQFIFTPVNQHRFVEDGAFPLIEALFYR